MASSLSDDEFQRMQNQLIDLRTSSYELANTNKKLENDYAVLQQKYETLDKDFQKVNKAILKSKKAKEVEMIIQENDSLQRKLHSQEEEFRLQNETLMQELATFVASNESLEKQVTELKSSGTGSSDAVVHDAQQTELRRLQAENTALRNKTRADSDLSVEDFAPTEIESLKKKLRLLTDVNSELEGKCMALTKQTLTPHNGSSDSEVHEDTAQRTESVGEESGSMQNLPQSSLLMDLVMQTEEKCQSLSAELQEVRDINLGLETEREENRMLKEQLTNFEASSKEQLHKVQEDLSRTSEKLKKKQESLLQLQEERENLYKNSKFAYDELKEKSEKELTSLSCKLANVQLELDSKLKEWNEERGNLEDKVKEMDLTVTSLHCQVNAAAAETAAQLQSQCQQLSGQLLQLQEEHGRKVGLINGLQQQLQDKENERLSLFEESATLAQERDGLNKMLAETTKVCEKRKTLLDDLAIRLQQATDDHREDIASLRAAHSKEIGSLTSKLHDETVKTKELQQVRDKLAQMKVELKGLEDAKTWLESALSETEMALTTANSEHAKEMQSSERAHGEGLESLTQGHQLEMEVLKLELNNMKSERDIQITTIDKLKQDAKDSIEDRKIHDKKGAQLVKDLKRQLHSERKRGEKLQERLQELLSSKLGKEQAIDDLLTASDESSRGLPNDTSSVGSWSLVSGGDSCRTSGTGSGVSMRSPTARAAPTTAGPETPPSPMSVVEQENGDLLDRIAGLQQKNWQLEEKMNLLEESSSAMADDLLQKTAIIQHYIMDGKQDLSRAAAAPDKLSLKRVIDFLKEKSDDNMHEMNRKLQRMLEETLTKNMHLQKDMEILSQQVTQEKTKE